MNKLIRPDNGQLSDFHAYRDGMIALDTTCVTPAVRWFTMQAVQVCNPSAKVLAAFDTGLDYCYPMPAPVPLTVVLTPEMAAHVNASALVSIVVRKPVTLWTPALRAA